MQTWHPLLTDLAVGALTEPPPLLEITNPDELRLLLGQADDQGVAYTVTRSILATQGWREAAGPEAVKALRGRWEDVVRGDMVWESAARAALAALPGQRPPILLKGAGARYLIYDEPGERSCVDLDVMIPGDAEELICSSLRAAGWRDEVGRRSPGWHVIGLSRTTPLATLSLEIHRTLDNPERGRVAYEELAPRCLEMEVLGRTCLVPDLPAQLLVAATHALRHGLDIPLKSLVDIHRIVQRLLDTGAQAAAQSPLVGVQGLLQQSPGAAATLGLMFRLSEELFATPVPREWLQALAPMKGLDTLLDLTINPMVPGYARVGFLRSPYLRRLWYQSLLIGSPIVMGRVLGGWVRRRLGRLS